MGWWLACMGLMACFMLQLTAAFLPRLAHIKPTARATRGALAGGEIRTPVCTEPGRKARFRTINPVELAEEEGRAGSGGHGAPWFEEVGPENETTYDTFDAVEDYGVAGSTLRDVSHDYSFPLEFLVSSCVRLGMSPPVDCDRKLGTMLGGEQIFALVEALTSLDPAVARDRFADQTLEETAEYFGVSIMRVFELCGELGLDVPFGVMTHLSTAQQGALETELERETGIEPLESGPPGSHAKRAAQVHMASRDSNPTSTPSEFVGQRDDNADDASGFDL